MTTSFYIILLFFGILYWITAFIVDLEILVGEFGLGVPYSFTIWGFMGLVGYDEPIPILCGISVYLIAFGLYIFLERNYRLADEILLKPGIVTIGIHPTSKGEIKITHDYGDQFYIAAAKEITKPIPKGKQVYVTSVENNIAIVEQEFPNRIVRSDISPFKSILFTLRKFITPSRKISAICTVCFGMIKQSKNGLQCPSCSSFAHNDHILTWLENNSICPNCKSPILWDGYQLKQKS